MEVEAVTVGVPVSVELTVCVEDTVGNAVWLGVDDRVAVRLGVTAALGVPVRDPDPVTVCDPVLVTVAVCVKDPELDPVTVCVPDLVVEEVGTAVAVTVTL